MLLLWNMDVTSTPRNHRDWLICLFALLMFGKINQKNKRVAFRIVIFAFCVQNTHAQTAVWKIFFSCELFSRKKRIWCVKALTPTVSHLAKPLCCRCLCYVFCYVTQPCHCVEASCGVMLWNVFHVKQLTTVKAQDFFMGTIKYNSTQNLF